MISCSPEKVAPPRKSDRQNCHYCGLVRRAASCVGISESSPTSLRMRESHRVLQANSRSGVTGEFSSRCRRFVGRYAVSLGAKDVLDAQLPDGKCLLPQARHTSCVCNELRLLLLLSLRQSKRDYPCLFPHGDHPDQVSHRGLWDKMTPMRGGKATTIRRDSREAPLLAGGVSILCTPNSCPPKRPLTSTTLSTPDRLTHQRPPRESVHIRRASI